MHERYKLSTHCIRLQLHNRVASAKEKILSSCLAYVSIIVAIENETSHLYYIEAMIVDYLFSIGVNKSIDNKITTKSISCKKLNFLLGIRKLIDFCLEILITMVFLHHPCKGDETVR